MPRVLFHDDWEKGWHVLITEPMPMGLLPENAQIAHQAADAFTASFPITTCEVSQSEFWHQMSARQAGVHSYGSTFGRTLKLCLRKWAS